ncbi:hypothetical protein NMY3_00292 [Candidatus Nitrosocosmicus oleophilus]|uniref:Uncharacterized protein n=1 Tax=Candidatus Nitrosocosmicus oleophilus TaxID=1353260 RepID=A0A654LVM5_9ARCH|nr:hypothetical protein NMY3_00292 [Candidatus Nitrosocosmicus oleophilus]
MNPICTIRRLDDFTVFDMLSIYLVDRRLYSTLNRVPTDAVSTFIINIISAHLSYVAIIKF